MASPTSSGGRDPRAGEEIACREIEPLLPLVADGTLDPQGDPETFAHVARCGHCQDVLARYDMIDIAIGRSAGARPRCPRRRWALERPMHVQLPASIAVTMAALIAFLIVGGPVLLTTPAGVGVPGTAISPSGRGTRRDGAPADTIVGTATTVVGPVVSLSGVDGRPFDDRTSGGMPFIPPSLGPSGGGAADQTALSGGGVPQLGSPRHLRVERVSLEAY